MAFTLVEVLITLGIIGVVAAMTIPTLITNIQKTVTVNRLKGSYSKFVQAMEFSQEEYGSIKDWGNSNYGLISEISMENVLTKFVTERIIPYTKVINNCGMNCPQVKNIKVCRLNKNYCNRHREFYYSIYIIDGSRWDFMVDNDGTKWSWMKMYIDINGDAGPNTWGKDIFTFSFNGKMGLYGYDMPRVQLLNHVREGCNPNAGDYSGDLCGGLIQQDGWKISKDYPW